MSVCTVTACVSRHGNYVQERHWDRPCSSRGQYRGYRCTITPRGAVDQIRKPSVIKCLRSLGRSALADSCRQDCCMINTIHVAPFIQRSLSLDPEVSGKSGRGSKFAKMYTHGRTRQSTHMYSVMCATVPMCTQSYTTGYIYVLCRVRVGTYMYSVVYDWVHICTLSYTTGYIYVLCLYE